jgi:replicative DNA helicase
MSSEYDNAVMPPSNIDAEKGVIGSILLMNEAIDEINSMLTPNSFYGMANQKLFAAIIRLHQKGCRAIDPVTLATELERSGDLVDVGGIPYIVEVLESVPHAAHARYYASIVAEHSMRREVIYLARESVRKAYDRSEEITETMGAMLESIESMFGRSSGDVRPFSEVVTSLRLRQLSPAVVQSTGLQDIDNRLRGFMDPRGGWKPAALCKMLVR